MTIGKRIKAKRKEQGLTLEEVGKVVGVSKQTIQRYESGEIANIPYDKLKLIGKALHCNCTDFFFDSNSDNPILIENHKTIELGYEESDVIDAYRNLYVSYPDLFSNFNKLSDEQKVIVSNLVKSMLPPDEHQ